LHRWGGGSYFAYRIEIGRWLIAVAMVALVASFVKVTCHGLHPATTDPVRALRPE
jgi:hypothetical protein